MEHLSSRTNETRLENSSFYNNNSREVESEPFDPSLDGPVSNLFGNLLEPSRKHFKLGQVDPSRLSILALSTIGTTSTDTTIRRSDHGSTSSVGNLSYRHGMAVDGGHE